MTKISRPILLDADAIIRLLEWDCYGKLCRALGRSACVAEAVREQVKYYTDQATGRRIRFNSSSITTAGVPRLVTVGELTDEQYENYLRHPKNLVEAHIGERETFALAWVLGFDVCSWDVDAKGIFQGRRPNGCCSEYLGVLDLLRSLDLIR